MKQLLIITSAALALSLAGGAYAQDADGDWAATIDTGAEIVQATVHIMRAPTGELSATADNPAQGIVAMPASSASLVDGVLNIQWDDIDGAFVGHWDAASVSWTGDWKQQGQDFPMTMTHKAGG